MGSIGKFVEDYVLKPMWVVSGGDLLFKVLGIETHEETITDLVVTPLLTPGSANDAARRHAKRAAKGSMEVYFKGYRAFQRDYRKKYSKQFMERQGYAPSSTATSSVITKVKAETYIQSTFGYIDVNVETFGTKYLTNSQKNVHAIQQVVGYDFPSSRIIVSGKHYNNHQYTYPTGNQVKIVSTRLYDETIIQNLTDNYAYDGTYVTILGEVYLVGTISSVVNGFDQYETICTHVDELLPNRTIYTDVERITNTVTNAAYATEADYIGYRVTSGEVGTELRHWVAVAGITTALYDTVIIDVTTIIPMKEDNVMVDTDDYKLNRMLRKLNLSGDVLRSNIENPQLDSAYLMTGVDPTSTRDADIRTLFRSFDLLSPGSGNIAINISKLSMKYTFSMTKSFVNGSIGPVGTYTKSVSGTGATTVMTLRFQGSSSEYKQLVISNFLQTYTVSGVGFAAYLTTGGGFCRIIVPLDILNSLSYKDFVDVYEYGLCLLAYSSETVKIKWYETGAFSTLVKIVTVAIAIITGNVWIMLAGMAFSYVVAQLAKMIGGTVGAIVAAVVVILSAVYFGGYGLDSTDLWMLVANQSISVINQSIAMEMDKLAVDAESYYRSMDEKFNQLEEDGKKFEDTNPYTGIFFDSAYAGTPNDIFRGISEYCTSIVGNTDIGYLVDYGSQIEDALMKRTTVVVM